MRVRSGVLTLAFAAASSMASAQAGEQLSLRAAVGAALTTSPLLRTSDDARQLAEIRAAQANGQFGLKASPSLSTGSDPLGNPLRTFGFGVSKRLPTGADVQATANSFRYGQDAVLRDSGYAFNVTQPLTRGFGITTAAERANTKRTIVTAERNAAEARHQLIVSTAEAYFAVLRQRRQIENAQRAVDRASRLRIGSVARAQVGLATELDVLRADLLSARAESSLAVAQEQLENALDTLKTTVGRRLDSDLELDDEALSDSSLQAAGLVPEPAALSGSPEEIVERLSQAAFAARLDLREARDRIADARRVETVARFNLFPQTSMNVTYTRRGLGSSTDLFGPLLNGWRVSFSSNYTLDRAEGRAAAATSSLTLHAAADEAVALEQRIRAEVRRAYRAWDRGRSAVDIQAKAVAIAEKQVRLAEIRYERGVAGNFDVVDAEGLLFQARADLEGARIDRALAGINLSRATGQLDPGRFQP